MPQGVYLPEGILEKPCYNASAVLERALEEKTILTGRAVLCTPEHDLIVELGDRRLQMPREEAALGIQEGTTKEIAVLSRVGKPVCFRVTGQQDGVWQFSRRCAQREALDWFLKNLVPGEVLRTRVTHLEPFGAFVDIGCGVISLIGIENISVSRIGHPEERFALHQEVPAVVAGIDPVREHILLTHRELLGTWQENADRLAVGQTMEGVVRGVENYGIFVELTPNLSGLAEYQEGIEPGMAVSVYIKAVLPEKMKGKLLIIDRLPRAGLRVLRPQDYRITHGRLREWIYTPPGSVGKQIETRFG